MAYKAYGDFVWVRRLLGSAGLKADCRLSPLGISIDVRVYMGRSSRFFSIKLPKWDGRYGLSDPASKTGLVEFATVEEAAQEIVNRVQQEGEHDGR